MIILVGNGNEKDQDYIKTLTDLKYEVSYLDLSQGLEQAVASITPDKDTIFVKANIRSDEYLKFLLKFKTESKAFNMMILQQHQKQFALLDPAFNLDFVNPQELAEVTLIAASKYTMLEGLLPEVLLFEAEDNPKIYSHEFFEATKKLLEEAGLKVRIGQLDPFLLDKSAEAKGLEFKEAPKLVVCDCINTAAAIFKSFLVNKWVSRGFIFNLKHDAVLTSRTQDIRSIHYTIKDLQTIKQKEEGLNNDNKNN